MNNRKTIQFAGVFFLMLCFLCTFYGKILLHPNSYLFSSTGDGMKNYYTYAYFIQHNKSFTNLEGLHYPYGENSMYTDCHPLQAVILKGLTSVFPPLGQYSIGCVNFFLIFSLLLTALLLYLIFRKLNIGYLLALFSSVGITVLSPQIFRLTGHYALGYAWAIPLVIYLILLLNRGERMKRLLLALIVVQLVLFFTHAYLGLMTVSLVAAYSLVVAVNEWLKEKRWSKMAIHLMLWGCLVPIGLFFITVKMIDTHVGRTTNPWGIELFHADFTTVFLPVSKGLHAFSERLFPALQQEWEGWAYIGLATLLALLGYALASINASWKQRAFVSNKTWIEAKVVRQLLVASVLVLLFSMYYPFRWNESGEWIDAVSILKQFRAIGRFAWVFYFTSTIAMVCITNRAVNYLETKGKRVVAYSIVVVVPFSLFLEGVETHETISREISASANLFDLHQTTQLFQRTIKEIDASRYQALVPFPFFYIGSENFGKPANPQIAQYAFLFSYHLKLPFVGSYLTRTGIDESKKTMQLLASNCYYKRIGTDIKSRKPFLLVCLNEGLSPREAYYLQRAKCLVKAKEYSIYEIAANEFFRNNSKEMFRAFEQLEPRLHFKKGYAVTDTSLYFSFNSFDTLRSPISFSGDGKALNVAQRDYTVLARLQKGTLDPSRKYIARCWFYNGGENYGQDALSGTVFFQQVTTLNGGEEKAEWLDPIVDPRNSHEINGDWSMVEVPLSPTDSNARYELLVKGSDSSKKRFVIDELLVYDSALEVCRVSYSKRRTYLFWNNVMVKGRD